MRLGRLTVIVREAGPMALHVTVWLTEGCSADSPVLRPGHRVPRVRWGCCSAGGLARHGS